MVSWTVFVLASKLVYENVTLVHVAVAVPLWPWATLGAAKAITATTPKVRRIRALPGVNVGIGVLSFPWPPSWRPNDWSGVSAKADLHRRYCADLNPQSDMRP